MGGIFEAKGYKAKLKSFETEIAKPNFWNNNQRAARVTKKINQLKQKMELEKKLSEYIDEVSTYLEIVEEDKKVLTEAVEHLFDIRKKYKSIEIETLLSGKNDEYDAILTIHPGAGGTESQDWAEMLFRMYIRWIEKRGFKGEIIDYLAADEAGLKSVTVEVRGENVFGFLQCEAGIHRLVRISPFNAQGKRQTSFASVFVYPIFDQTDEVKIDPKDIRIDTYKSSGKGGQGVNTTDSAVRITHTPTGIVVQCQNERSQLQNKEHAMKILRSRLLEQIEKKQQKKNQTLEDGKTEIGWGNQIRSYVMHPYQMVKDHRTNYETGNVSAVMDGDLDGFISAFLKLKKNFIGVKNG